MEIKAVLFDCDGLMFNTEEVSQNMWRRLAGEYNESIPEDFFRTITGAKKGIDLSHFKEAFPHLDEVSEAMHERRFDLDFWSQYYPDGLNKKGLVKLYLYCRAQGIAMAVCSSSNHHYVETLIRTVSTPMKFDAIVGGDMVTHGKPDPEIFLKGAELLGVKPEECLVLEDSRQGIIASHRAGMHSVFIEDTIAKDEEMESVIEYERKSLDEVIELLK